MIFYSQNKSDMSKKSKLYFLGAAAVVVVIAYIFSDSAPSSSLSSREQTIAIIETSDCMTCHSKDAQLPFYGSWPIIGPMVEYDMVEGCKHFDMDGLYAALKEGGLVAETKLAKIEYVVEKGTMPMLKYSLAHPGTSVNSTEREMVLAWVKSVRSDNYHNSLSSEEFANEPVRPVKVIDFDGNKAALGFDLYHDTRLSADGSVACATCHDLATAGVDNLQYSEGIDGQFGGVNAPTVFNAAYNFVQFWDGRAATLALQAAGPPLNPVEMGYESFDQIVATLLEDKELVARFSELYSEGVTEATITDAIAEFEKGLITPNAPFDKYLMGDKGAISASAIEGYQIFKDNSCATCHVGEILGGKSYEFMGLYKDYFKDRGLELTEEDNGRYKESAVERDRHRFKVPGLRNVVLTAPYYHDGSRKDLDKAVADMAIYQSGVTLSSEQTSKIVEFLGTLTGEYNGKQLTNNNI